MVKLSENFTLEEMLWSATAYTKGIKNDMTDPKTITENLRNLCLSVLQPVRNHFGPITVSSGYSCPELARILGRKPTSQHCFDEKTEILTTEGWKDINSISLTDIPYSYNISKKVLEKDSVLSIIKRSYNGKMYSAKTSYIDYLVTDKHRMLVASVPHKNKQNNWQIKEAHLCKNKRLNFMVSAKTNNPQSGYDINVLKMVMAIISDGCIYQKKGTLSPIIRFNISKQRKIRYIENLLETIGIPYRKRYCKNRERYGQYGVYEITINQTNSKVFLKFINEGKQIPYCFLDLSSEELKTLIYTYSFFDGCKDRRDPNWKYFTIFSTNKHNADMLQSMAILSGLRCIMKKTESNTSFGPLTCYQLSILPTEITRVSENSYYEEDYKGYVWCIQTNNTTLICRRNGKAFVCGNCSGQAADIISNRVQNKELAVWIKRNLVFDQLIYECRRRKDGTYYDWVHVSYRSDGKNRKEVLSSPPGGGYIKGILEKNYV